MSGSGPIYEYQRELTAKLEQVMRERDEARKYAEERNDEANKLQRFLNMAAQERDEARLELSHIRAEYERVNASDLTRDALALQNAALRVEVERFRNAVRKKERLELEAVQELDEARAEVARLRSALKLLWEEATDESRCAVERSAGDYAHQLSTPCRELVRSLVTEGKP